MSTMSNSQPIIPPEPTGIELILRDMKKATRESFERDVLLAMQTTRLLLLARSTSDSSLADTIAQGEREAWDAVKRRLQTAYADQLGRPDPFDSYRKRF